MLRVRFKRASNHTPTIWALSRRKEEPREVRRAKSEGRSWNFGLLPRANNNRMALFGPAIQAMRLFFAIVYPLLYSAAALLYLPVYLGRLFSRQGRVPLLERAWRLPAKFDDLPPADGHRIWIHAVSVGEVQAVRPLVDRLHSGGDQVLVSTTTETGQRLAETLPPGPAACFYFPLDWQTTCRRYLRALRPDAVALAETEIWPGFIRAAGRLGTPLVLVNGRLSDRSFGRYRRLRPLLRPLLESFSAFCMQSRRDKERILELGAPPERVHLTGNLKYDYQLPDDPEKRLLAERLQALMKPDPGDLLWICGSTREGEEQLLLEAFARLRPDVPQLRLLLAPRHPHRIDQVEAALRRSQIPWLVRSRLDFEDPPPARPVLVLDSIGELAHLYGLADMVFIGGSLFPTGGQNLIEAAHFGKPILFGPHMENFREVADAFLDAYAALQVRGHLELVPKLLDLARDPAARKWLGRNARKVVRDNQGAVERTVEILRECAGKGKPLGGHD